MSNSNDEHSFLDDEDVKNMHTIFKGDEQIKVFDENLDYDLGNDFGKEAEAAQEFFFDDNDDQISRDTPVASTSTINVRRRWLILAVSSAVLFTLLALLLGPMINLQENRQKAVTDVIRDVDLTNLYALQALTAEQSYEPFEQSLSHTQKSVERLIEPSNAAGTLANVFFDNARINQVMAAFWSDYQSLSQRFLSNQAVVIETKDKLAQLNAKLDEVGDACASFVATVAKEGRNGNSASLKNKYLVLTSAASTLNNTLTELTNSVAAYYQPQQDLAQLVDQQNGLVVELKETFNRIVTNTDAVVQTASRPLGVQLRRLETRVLSVGDNASAISASRATVEQMRAKLKMLATASQKSKNYSDSLKSLARLMVVVPLVFAGLAAYAFWRYARIPSSKTNDQAVAIATDTADDQQESILKLLDEMSKLADGDLTIQAEVTDQITGAIADAINYAITEMRELVTQINRASNEVANESKLAVSNAQSVSQSNMQQSDEISSAADLMRTISSSMVKMSEQANSSSKMAGESINAAEQGAQAVRDTIEGMENMREQIQETSKRIKRLGESSQRIGDIVALIDDIAEQTNILSLNAAIQASMAGEAGRGFAVVSDEVQSLAERSTEATKRIAELVNTIQNDTNDAVLSMEKATEQVVSGTRVADSAGNALAEIEKVSKALSQLVVQISQGSSDQAKAVTRVSEQVSVVSESSTNTSQKARDSANSIAKLLELAKDLESSVSRFKLPASN